MTELRPSEPRGKVAVSPFFAQNPKFWPHFTRYQLQTWFASYSLGAKWGQKTKI